LGIQGYDYDVLAFHPTRRNDMSYEIKKAAVLGAGVMGASIAAHLTNAGIECLLLDIIPFQLTDADKMKGLI
jgi:3-hydroxyacyl-CoA dehydrogenase